MSESANALHEFGSFLGGTGRRQAEPTAGTRPDPRVCVAARIGRRDGRFRVDGPPRFGPVGRDRFGEADAWRGVLHRQCAPTATFEERQPAQWDKKRQIAERASQLVQNGDTLLLDGGSTTYEVARLLVGRPLQIVTNSLPVANLFASATNTRSRGAGGYVYPRTGVTLGPYANDMLAGLSVRKTILSVAGINERGFFNSNLLLVETERAMMRCCRGSDRRGRQHEIRPSKPGKSVPLEAVHCLIVDAEIEPKWQ